MPYEYHGIVYDTTNEKLAKLLEAIRQRQKQDNPFRITVKWISGEFKPYSGYIVFTHPQRLTQWDKDVSFPLLAWKANSSSGKHLDPTLIESIEFASSALRQKHHCEHLYKCTAGDSYFSPFSNDLISTAIY